MATPSDLTPLGQFIKRRLDELGWSQNRLGEESRIGSSSVSKLMRGLIAPTHENIEAIANALRIDQVRLKKEAGLSVVTPHVLRDPSVEYIAQQIDGLPPDIRTLFVEAIESQLKVIYRTTSAVRGSEPSDPLERMANTLREIKASDPDFYEELMRETEARSK